MKVTKTKLEGVVIVEPRVFGDHRGFFMESWSKKKFEEAGLFYDFVQDNHSSSTVKGTLRGIHFQRGDMAQAKLVRCARGAVLDVAVDLRPNSPTYKQWVAVELSEENKKQLMIPMASVTASSPLPTMWNFCTRPTTSTLPRQTAVSAGMTPS